MRQIVQYPSGGKIVVTDAPEPIIGSRQVKIRTLHSLISAGTERSKIELGSKSLIGKARARPDLVSKVISNARKNGLWATVDTVRNRLKEATPLGYSVAGIVTEVGSGAAGVQVGDLVAAAGAGFANHAECVVVPHTLVTSVPQGINSENAAFATIGAIALQGVRQAQPLIGETFLVIGLGLIGQLTVQILRANGCRVLGLDLVESLVERAERVGGIGIRPGDDPIVATLSHTAGYGVDGVIITASTTSNEPVELAGEVTREKGRVVVVGDVKLDIPREPFYIKEIDIRISRSYGPGRYDYNHEEGGTDYPYSYVRFTEGRNMRAFLDLVADKKIDVAGLVTHRFPIGDATEAYKLLSGARKEPYLGILISYPDRTPLPNVINTSAARVAENGKISVSFIGAGNYAVDKLLPALRATKNVSFARVCTASGLSAVDIAERFKFESQASSPADIISGPERVVFVATRHSTHAALAVAALEHGKHTFVEKPLCLERQDLELLASTFSRSKAQLLVGFNRRFSPFVKAVIEHFGANTIEVVTIRINAGRLPKNHWSLDPEEGGRVIGEVCHFIDLAAALTGSMPMTVEAISKLGEGISAKGVENSFVQVRMRNGALASIAYFADGSPALSKERIECHGSGKSAIIDDFNELTLYYGSARPKRRRATQDKGQAAMIDAFLSAIGCGKPAIAPSVLFSVSEATLAVIESICSGTPITITDYSRLDPPYGS